MTEGIRSVRIPLWTVPICYSIAAFAGGLILPRVETHFLPYIDWGMSASAATAIFSSIASGMITLTGVVFSLAFVMVQFGSTAYSPRLVLWIVRDPVLFHAMGSFTATFLYSLGALSWVDRYGSGKVPFFCSWLAILLLMVSVGLFVALVQRLRILQVGRMLAFTAGRGRKAIESLYRRRGAGPAPDAAGIRGTPVTQVVNHRGPMRTVQAVDAEAMGAVAESNGAVIEVVPAVGDVVLDSLPLLRIHGSSRNIPEEALLPAIQLGDERTFEQDPKYAIRLLVDIAIRALSPAVNDPTTAIQALDHIEDLLMRLGRCDLDIEAFRDGAGAVRVLVPFPSWDDFLALAFEEIRACGGGSVQVMRRMNALVDDLLSALPEERHAALLNQRERLTALVERSFASPGERMEASIGDRQGLGGPGRLTGSGRRRAIAPASAEMGDPR